MAPKCMRRPAAAVRAAPAPAVAVASETLPALQSAAVELSAPVAPEAPRPAADMLDWLTDEDDTARLAVYLVTLAQVLEAKALAADQPLRTLDGLSRADVRDAILGAVRSPAATRPGGWGRVVPLDVEKMVVFFENPQHFHVALKLPSRSAFMPLKLALRQNSGLASHWSTLAHNVLQRRQIRLLRH